MADVNILQGAIFHEDVVDGVDGTDVLNSDEDENQKGKFESSWNPLESKTKQLKNKSKPAAHRVTNFVVLFFCPAHVEPN